MRTDLWLRHGRNRIDGDKPRDYTFWHLEGSGVEGKSDCFE
jgi:hypothetical protein